MPTCFNCSKAVRAFGADDGTLLPHPHNPRQLDVGLSNRLRGPMRHALSIQPTHQGSG